MAGTASNDRQLVSCPASSIRMTGSWWLVRPIGYRGLDPNPSVRVPSACWHCGGRAGTVAYHAFAGHPGAEAGGLGYVRRPDSRLLRPAHEETMLMAQRWLVKDGAPQAWAGERAPCHLPCSTLACSPRPAAHSAQRTSATGRSRRAIAARAAIRAIHSRLPCPFTFAIVVGVIPTAAHRIQP